MSGPSQIRRFICHLDCITSRNSLVLAPFFFLFFRPLINLVRIVIVCILVFDYDIVGTARQELKHHKENEEDGGQYDRRRRMCTDRMNERQRET